MHRTLIPFLITLFFVAAESVAQDQSDISHEPQTSIKSIKNDAGQPYQLIVTLPAGYDAEKQYKILYYLDAWWLKDLVAGCYRIETLSSKMEDLILVGISSVGNELDWHSQRNQDFTPSSYDIAKMKISMKSGSLDLGESTSGGAEKFMQFLKAQIIDTIETTYKIDAASRGILGHSLGGLFGFYSFVKHPDLFTNYILLSPSVWWNQSELFIEDTFLENRKATNVFMVMGSAERSMLKQPILDLSRKLQSKSTENVNLMFKEYEGATHNSVLPQGIYDGLLWLYTRS